MLARRLISLTDLTSLNEADDAASVGALSLLARSAPVKPAAVCIWARGIPAALDVLRGRGSVREAPRRAISGSARPHCSRNYWPQRRWVESPSRRAWPPREQV